MNPLVTKQQNKLPFDPRRGGSRGEEKVYPLNINLKNKLETHPNSALNETEFDSELQKTDSFFGYVWQ
jgi:hypothetical protein